MNMIICYVVIVSLRQQKCSEKRQWVTSVGCKCRCVGVEQGAIASKERMPLDSTEAWGHFVCDPLCLDDRWYTGQQLSLVGSRVWGRSFRSL